MEASRKEKETARLEQADEAVVEKANRGAAVLRPY
jgi:hypothetical protein